MCLSQYNPGGRWSGGGTGGWTEGQVHMEVERPGTKAEKGTQAKPAKQEDRAEQRTRVGQRTRVEPARQGTRAEQVKQEATRAGQKTTRLE